MTELGWRETRGRARRQVHAAFAYPAAYFAPGSATPTPCQVRVHEAQTEDTGMDAGDFGGFARRAERPAQVVFDLSEVKPTRHGVVRTEDHREFRVERTLPANGGFQACEVVEP